MDMLLFFIGVLGFIGSLVLLVINLIKKKSKKTALIALIVSVVLVFVGLLMDPVVETPDVADEPIEEELEEDEPEEDEEVTDDEIVEHEVEEKEVEEEEPKKEVVVDRNAEIKSAIKSRINEGDYNNTNLDSITVNDNLGDEGGETYIALVYLEFDIKNRRKTANEIMKMYSDDLAATLANKGIKDIAEIAIFWEDEYNDRNVKYAYEYKDGQFFVIDIAGE